MWKMRRPFRGALAARIALRVGDRRREHCSWPSVSHATRACLYAWSTNWVTVSVALCVSGAASAQQKGRANTGDLVLKRFSRMKMQMDARFEVYLLPII